MSMSQRAKLVEERLAELDARDPDSLTPEQLAYYAQLRREHELNAQEQAREQHEQQRDAAERERQQAEYTEALARHNRARVDREKLLAEADEHDRLAAELRALYDAGGSWADVAPRSADRATVIDAHAAAADRPRARLTLREALSKVRIATGQAGLDPDSLTAAETAELLTDMKDLSAHR